MTRDRIAALRKTLDETNVVRCRLGTGVIREEVWQNAEGEVVRYNLAFINHSLFSNDNGRVLGYDNQHGHHHRHYTGGREQFAFVSYARVLARFLKEVRHLRETREPL